MKKLFKLWTVRDNTLTGENPATVSKRNKIPRIWLYVGGGLLVILVAGAVALILIPQKKHPIIQSNPATKTPTERILSHQAPAEASGKVGYYAELGEEYAAAGNYQKALEAMLTADTFVTDRVNGRSVNVGIARMYKSLNNKPKAIEYFQKEIDRIKDTPENTETVQFLQKKIAELK